MNFVLRHLIAVYFIISHIKYIDVEVFLLRISINLQDY